MTEPEVRYYAEITEQRTWLGKRPTGRWDVKLWREGPPTDGLPAVVWSAGNFDSYNAAHLAADAKAWEFRREDKDRTRPDRIEVAKERDA